MVDSGEYDWCHYDCAPFDRPTFFFCVQVDHQILIGSRKADWKWEYDSSQMLGFRGKTISLRYDDGSMWIIRTDGKDMHLTQDYSRNVFTRPECVAELHRHWLQQFNQIKRPDTVPAESVLVPQGPQTFLRRTGAYFWAMCTLDSDANRDLCALWDEKGSKYKSLACTNPSNGPAAPNISLPIDPLTTTEDYEIHLKNGMILRNCTTLQNDHR